MENEGRTLLKPYIETLETDFENFATRCLEITPKYFWEIPGSKTGKRHPKFDNVVGGTVKHTVVAMYIGEQLCITYCMDKLNHDLILTALCLHDTLKYGLNNDYDDFVYHPIIPRHFYKSLDDFEHYNEVMDLIESHMGNINGEWGTTPLIQPVSIQQQIVHISDFIASRSKMDFDFEG